MPIPTPSRHSRTTSPGPALVTPSRSSTRSLASYSNYTPTVTSGGTSGRMNIVTRVALEGRAKPGEDGAAIKMYLKIAVPTDSIAPSANIPLFPEENVKILSSQVHPLDNNSVPYNFSSALSPLLHKAACALNLPARSQETFNSTFDIASSNVSTPSSTCGSKHENPEAVPPVDPQYTGQILVSGYNISYVLPKYFPIHEHEDSYPRTPLRSRRASIGERNTAQFMVAIDMWVPYASRPPRHPYLLSIPTPRCLHNHIKLKIFPPNNNNASASYASLSSVEDEGSSWDLTSDPHVTRATTSKRSLGRNNSYGNFADDESSDSSTAGFADGCGIQGTFPSAERIRIRWARPSKSVNVPGGGRDGRRRVGVKTVKGEMSCVVRGKRGGPESGTPEGILMDVSYTGSCSGVWFPGVATLLGMDVGLEAKGCDVSWTEGGSSQWEVKGGNGFTGFDVGPSSSVPQQHNSRGSSFDSGTQGDDLASSNGSAQGFLSAQPQTSRSSSSSSTASLLRAPLPAGNIGDYSFEGSNASLVPNGHSSSPMGTVSTVPSISASMQSLGQPPNPPGLPLTLHLNMNDLLPPAKNHFTFTISGTVVLTPKNSLSRMGGMQSRSSSPTENLIEGLVMLPKFTVLAADSESTTTTVRNEMETPHGAVDVYHATGDIRDAQAKKTVLQRGGFTKCGNEGARIAVKDHDPFKRDEFSSIRRPTTPIAPSRTVSQAITLRTPAGPAVPYAPPPTIPVVQAKIFPFPAAKGLGTPTVYSVSLQLNAPITRDSEWLEFGFAHEAGVTNSGSKGDASKPPKLQLVSATCDGVPVEVESSVSTEEIEMSTYGVGFEKMGGQDWVSWVKLRVGEFHGGHVSVEYLVRENGQESTKGKEKERGNVVPVLLPTFSLPVGKFDVMICDVKDYELEAATSNFAYQQAVSEGRRLMHFSADAWFYPHLTLTFAEKKNLGGRQITQYFALTWILFALASFAILRTLGRLPQVSITLPEHRVADHSAGPEWTSLTVSATVYETVTVEATSIVYETATIYATSTETARVSSHQQPPSPSSSLPASPLSSSSVTRKVPPRPTTTRSPPRSIPAPSSPTSTPGTLTPTPQPTSTHHQFSLEPFRETFKLYLPDDFDDLYNKASDVAGVVWQILRRAWHYPLPPP